MSRSHRKPIRTQFQDSPGVKKVSKRMANKAVRRASKAETENQEIIERIERAERDKDQLQHIPLKEGVSSGSAFKRIFNSWNICDWKFWDTKGRDKRSGRK